MYVQYLCPLQSPAVRQPENRNSAVVCWISSLSFPPIQPLFTSKNNILPSGIGLYAGAVTPRLLLVYNNAWPHVAGACQQFLNDEYIDSIDWPACFPLRMDASASTSLHQGIQKLTEVLLQVALSYKIIKTTIKKWLLFNQKQDKYSPRCWPVSPLLLMSVQAAEVSLHLWSLPPELWDSLHGIMGDVVWTSRPLFWIWSCPKYSISKRT